MLFVLSQTKPVQRAVARQGIDWLSHQLKTEVKLEDVHWRNFQWLEIKGFLIRDLQSDTLLAVDRMAVHFSLLDLLSNKLVIEEVDMSNALIQIEKDSTQNWNFDFIIKAFADTSTTIDTTTKSTSWQIDPQSIRLQQVQIRYSDVLEATQLSAKFDDLNAEVDLLDLANSSLTVSQLDIQKPDIQYFDYGAPLTPVSTSSDTTAGTFVFPDLGWRINVAQSQLADGRFQYKTSKEANISPGVFNASDILLDAVQWDIQQISVDPSRIEASFESLSLRDHSGFEIRQLSTDLIVGDSVTALQAFQLSTPYSQAQCEIDIQYPGMEALAVLSGETQKYTSKDIRLLAKIPGISIAPKDINFFAPSTLSTSIKDDFILKGTVSGTLAQLTMDAFYASLGKELLFSANGQLMEVLNSKKLKFDGTIEQIKADYTALSPFFPDNSLPKGLERWGGINISGRLNGGVEDLKTERLTVNTLYGPNLKGDIQINGLSDFETAEYHFRIDSLTTSTQDWQGFVNDSFPPLLTDMGEMVIQGTFDGSLYQFDIDLKLDAAIGALSANTYFDFNSDYSNASYKGDIQLQDFDLGILSGDTLLGDVTLEAVIDGKGFEPKDWDTDVKMVLSDLTYQKYQYDNIQLDGRLETNAFDGTVFMDDPNLKFLFKGRFPILDTLPAYKFSLQLDTFDLKSLGLYATPLSGSTYLEADIQDVKIDDLKGTIALTNLSFQDSINRFQTDSIWMTSDVNEDGTRSLYFVSDLLQLGLEGNYRLSTLASEIMDWVDQDFPIHEAFFPLDSVDVKIESFENDLTFPSTDVKGYLRMGDPSALSQMLVPDLKTLDTLDIKLEFDQSKERWELDLLLPALQYADLQVDSFQFNSSYKNENLENIATANRFQYGDNTIIKNPYIQAFFVEDSLQLEVSSSENKDTVSWKVNGALTADGKELQFNFAPDIRLNGQDWKINSDHRLIFSDKMQWEINKLLLEKGRESILLNAQIDEQNDISIATLGFTQFDVDALAPLLDFPNGYMSGVLNGNVEANHLLTNLNYTANLDLQNWAIDSTLIGNLKLQAKQKIDQPIIALKASLKGNANEVRLDGIYDKDEGSIDVYADISRLEMENMDPFLAELIHSSEGYLSGEFTYKGSPKKTDLKGKLQLHDIKTTIDYVNIPYSIAEGTIDITQNKIDFGTLELSDANNEKATLNGQIRHRFFEDIEVDLHFETNRFQFLKTTRKDNELFYGDLLLETSVDMTGPLEKIQYNVVAKAQDGTQLYVVPLTDEQAIGQDDFIIFGRPELDSLGRDTNYLNTAQLTSPGIDLQLNLEMTPEAILEVIVDPLTGDKLVCKGVSNLTVDMGAGGDVSIFGNYEITEGQYSFSYEQLLKRDFTILPNSKISFDGDPLRARLDIVAAYQARVPLSGLVQDQLGDAGASLSGLRADVQVQMKITGNLIQPTLSFDIVLLGNPQGAVADAARARLLQLRTDETGLNTQVFGLLLFNSFIDSGNNSQSVSSAGESVVLSSISKLVSNKLNQLAGGVLKGVDINLGVEAYRPGVDPGINTEVQLGLSKRLFNDRLTVKVGGNLNVGASGQEEETLTALTGDFALEYQLTANGNYLLRVYQRSDYDAIYEGNVNKTGAGISIRKTYKNKNRKRK